MKIRHRIPGWVQPASDPGWEERVEREAERTTNATEQAHRKAEARLTRAVAKAEAAEAARAKADSTHVATRRIERLWVAVDQRRAELRTLQHIANASPAGSQNRGTGAHRGVATGETL